MNDNSQTNFDKIGGANILETFKNVLLTTPGMLSMPCCSITWSPHLQALIKYEPFIFILQTVAVYTFYAFFSLFT